MFLKLLLTTLFSISVLFASSITIEGTGDSQEVLRALAKSYENKHPGTSIIIPNSVGSSGGIKKVIAGKCELGRVARELKDKEKKEGLSYLTFGYSPIVFVVNADIKNPDLLKEDIINIFNGKTVKWEEFPNTGLKGKIYIVNREQGDSSRNILNKYFHEFKKITEPAGTTAYYNQEALSMLSKHENTIGYLAVGNIRGTGLRIIKIDGIDPMNPQNIITGKYKFVTPLSFVHKGEVKGLAKDFIAYLKSKEAAKIMYDFGVISKF